MLAPEHPATQPVARHPLSALQTGMLFHHLRAPGDATDVQQVVLYSSAALDAERLQAAWRDVTERYDVFRTSFRWDTERPLAEVWPVARLAFSSEEFTAAPGAERDAAIERCLDEERAQIDLSRAPLSRVRVLRFAPDEHAIVWTNHHAILDGRARSIVLREIARRYAGGPIGPVASQFSRHVAWLAERPVDSDEPFWRTYLDGFSATTPLPPSARPENAGPAPAAVDEAFFTLDAGDTDVLTRFARTQDVTLNVLVQSAWALLLSRCSGIPDVVFGAVRACRNSGAPGSAEIVGPLINTLPMRVRIDEDATVATWLRDVRAQWQALRDVEHTPLPAIAAWTAIGQPAPLFGSLVVFEHETLAVRARTSIDPYGALGIRDARVIDRTGYPLTLAAAGSDRLELRLQADPLLYDADDAERLLEAVAATLLALPAAARVRDVSMTSARERERVLGFNYTTSFPRDASVPELFAEIVAQYPDSVAAQLGAETITYAELAARATDVAFCLRAAGIGRGDYVGVCVERSFDMLAALVGILQAGAASVALDPLHPAERVAFMLAEAGTRLVLGQRHMLAALAPALARSAAVETVAIEDIARFGDAPFVLERPVHALDPAHVMYTSGSTGTPKGAVLPHRAIVRTVRGAEYLRFERDETFFAFVPLTFDVAVLEIWGPLLNGARLVLCPPGLPSLDVLGETIESQGVTTLWLTTALFEHMVEEQLPRLSGLHALIVGGDVMSPAHARRAIAALPQARLLNVCGPTEATVLIVAQPLVTPPHRPIPIGLPIANARVYVLDPDRRPVPVGLPGELYTGGDGVALGYVNRPDLTAERFVSDPLDPEPGATMYRTGDLGRWNADGSIVSLGRLDTQVKINGIRIEPGEIESALTEYPDLREAVVIAVPSPAGAKVLVAYAVPRDGVQPEPAAIRAFLAERVPSAMVPSHIVFLASLPITATGKFDRKALPAVDLSHAPAHAPAGRRPEGPAEITIAAHVEELLERDDVGRDDDFFSAGGDSLRAMRLVSRLRTVFGVDLSIRDVLAAPSIAGITATVRRLRHGAVGSPASLVTALRSTGGKPPFVFLHGDLAGGGRYCHELLQRIDDRPMYVIAPNGTETGSAPPETVEAAAREAIAALAAVGVSGPLLLGGFCNGGTIAYEMARQLARAGRSIEGVILIDAVPRNVGLPLRKRLRLRFRTLLDRLGYGRWRLPRSPGADASWEAWHEYVVDRWHYTLADYVPGTFAGEVSLLWSDETAPQADAFTAAWRARAPLARSGRISGTHLTSITRHLAHTCAVIAAHVAGAPDAAARDWDERATSLDHLQRTPDDAAVLT